MHTNVFLQTLIWVAAVPEQKCSEQRGAQNSSADPMPRSRQWGGEAPPQAGVGWGRGQLRNTTTAT